jgi:hypothetical protein
MKYSNNNYQRCWQAMSARWYPVKIKSTPHFLSVSPTSIITVITSSSYGIASLSTHLGVRRQEHSKMAACRHVVYGVGGDNHLGEMI